MHLINKYKNLATHAIPALIAILISGMVDVQMLLNQPLGFIFQSFIKNPNTLIVTKIVSWNFFQLIPAFCFGFLSDTHLRKNYLVAIQVLGILWSVLLLVFGFDKWLFLIFLGLTFNPLSVARAAILDNYNKISAIRIIAVTYFFKNLPWLFVTPLLKVPIEKVFYVIIFILILNTLLTIKFFKDKFDSKKKIEHLHEIHEQKIIHKNWKSICFTFTALALAETTFYLFWLLLEENPMIENRLLYSTLLTFIGLGISLFYYKIPHISIITKLYLSIAIFTVLGFLVSLMTTITQLNTLSFIMIINCLLGGVYLPFATDALIELSGAKRKATGSAFAEIADVAALILAAGCASFEWHKINYIFYTMMGVFILAAIMQKISQNCIRIKVTR